MPKVSSSDPFTVNHFVKWAKKLELDNGERWEVEDYFARYVEDVFAAMEARQLMRLWLIVPEGNAKTTNLAGLALYHGEFRPRAFVPWAASSRDQAEIGYQQAAIFGASMPRSQRPRFQDGYRRVKFANGSRIQVFAAGAEHADGVIPTMPIIDELHRTDLKLYRTWAGKLRKREAQMLVISTAGEPGSDFEVTREKIKAEATDVLEDGPAYRRYATERVVMHEYAVRDDAILDMEMVKAANPASWVDEDYLQQKLSDPDMTEAHWRRFTCNIATLDAGKEPYLDEQDWDAGADPDAEIGDGEVYLGADGSRTWDTTVVAWAQQDPDGIVTVDARVFSVRDGIEAHVHHRGGRIDFDDVESFVIDCFDRMPVRGAAYDPRYLERSMEIVQTRLPEREVKPVEPSSKAMRDALQTMFNLAAEGKLRHRGDPILRQHVLNAGVDRGQSSEIRRVRKIDGRLPIDAVPAMALAVWRASNQEPSVYEERGMVFA